MILLCMVQLQLAFNKIQHQLKKNQLYNHNLFHLVSQVQLIL